MAALDLQYFGKNKMTVTFGSFICELFLNSMSRKCPISGQVWLMQFKITDRVVDVK